jgi:hypothetical protein
MNVTTILLVTWFFAGQVPASYQTLFSSPTTCEAAKAKVLAAQQSLIADEASYVADIKSKGVIQMPRSIYVSAICTAQ